MKRYVMYLLLSGFVGASFTHVFPAESPAQGGDLGAQSREPFKIFDNLYYVGIDFVSAYLAPTSDGLILIDALFANSADNLLENIRKLGFRPEDIRYIFVSHSHGDHFGGAARIKAVSGAQIGMAAGDWDVIRESANPMPPDLVIQDGQSITLGDTTFRFYVTPGHTPGVLSMEFPVRDGNRTHKAFMFGGMGLNFSGVDRAEMYLSSVRRVLALEDIEVNITNHQGAGRIFERADMLAARNPGEPHPFVDPAGFRAWMAGLERNGAAKLEEEKRAAGL